MRVLRRGERITWKASDGEEQTPGIVRKAGSFVKTMVRTAIDGFVPETVFCQRMATCHDCEKCIVEENKSYCRACGCGKWKLSELSVKNRMAGHACPKGKFGAWKGGEA